MRAFRIQALVSASLALCLSVCYQDCGPHVDGVRVECRALTAVSRVVCIVFALGLRCVDSVYIIRVLDDCVTRLLQLVGCGMRHG